MRNLFAIGIVLLLFGSMCLTFISIPQADAKNGNAGLIIEQPQLFVGEMWVYNVTKKLYSATKSRIFTYELIVEVTAKKTWNDQNVYEINYTQVVNDKKYLARSDYVTKDWILLRSIDYLMGPDFPRELVFNPGLKIYDFPLHIDKKWTFFTNVTIITTLEGKKYVGGPRILEVIGEVVSEVEINIKVGTFNCLKINITAFDHGPWPTKEGEYYYERIGPVGFLWVYFFEYPCNIVYFSPDIKYYPKFQAYYYQDHSMIFSESYELANAIEAIQIKGISLFPQETSYSCWAASSLMALDYYGTYSNRSLAQVELAREMGDKKYYWDGLPGYEILPIVGRWESTIERLGKVDFDREIALTFDEIVDDINLGRPIFALYAGDLWIWRLRIPIKLIPFHVVVITGYIDRPDTTNDSVIVYDTWPPGKGVKEAIPWWVLKNELWIIINAVRTRPQVLEGTILTLQESQHKLYLHVYDMQGHHTGFNSDKNQVEENIPHSRYLDLNGTIIIILPSNVTGFSYIVDAKYAMTQTENYTLIITNLRNGTLTSELRKMGVIKQNEKQEFVVAISRDAREIRVEIVKEPWWQIRVYGAPLYALIIILVIGCIFLVFVKRKFRRSVNPYCNFLNLFDTHITKHEITYEKNMEMIKNNR